MRAGFLLGLAAAVLLGGLLRLGTRAEVNEGGRFRPMTPDDNYHLRRARFAVAHYPRTILFDPLMNFPAGGVPIWPPLYDVLLATPARVFEGSSATPDGIERAAECGTGPVASVDGAGTQYLRATATRSGPGEA